MVDDLTADVQIAADVTQISVARRFVRQELAERVPADVSSDLQLIVSELVTNAIEHGNAESVVVTVHCSDGDAAVTVYSRGPAGHVGPADTWTIAERNRITGRGLGIVRSVADAVEAEATADRLVVTAHRHFDVDL